jgi:hypothetical protein
MISRLPDCSSRARRARGAPTLPCAAALFALLCCLAFPVRAQEMDAPIAVQVELIPKILSFAHTLRTSHTDEYRIGVVYQRSYRSSVEVKDRILSLESAATLNGRPVRFVALPVESSSRLAELLQSAGVDAVYIAPLRAYDMHAVTQACRTTQVVSVTGVTSYVPLGVSVGVGLRGSKPQILINVAAAKPEGTEFSARLLSIATIIR